MPEILKTLADNPALFEAVKSVLLKQFTTSEGEVEAFTDEQLGQRVRARIVGTQAVENAFKEIKSYKTPEPIPPKINEAR